jgi:hypothetical protein
VVAFSVGFVGILLVYFPVSSLELAVQNEINQRLPEPVKLTQFSFVFPYHFEGSTTARLRGERLVFPFRVRFHPGWSRFSLTVVSPPDSEKEDSFPFSATVQIYKKTFEGEVEEYPLDRILPNQTGSITGQMNGSVRRPPNGDFRFTATVPRLIDSPLYPPFFHGLRINELSVKGSVQGRRVSMESIDLTSDKFLLNGSASMTLKQPVGETQVDLDIEVEQPLQKSINQSFTLRNFGY